MENKEIMLNNEVIENATEAAVEVIETSKKNLSNPEMIALAGGMVIAGYVGYKLVTKGIPAAVKGAKKLWKRASSKKTEEQGETVDVAEEDIKEVEDSEI